MMTETRTVAVIVTLVVVLAASGCSTASQAPPDAAPGASAQTSVTSAEARTIARDEPDPQHPARLHARRQNHCRPNALG